jgi:hypothetical protein
MSVSIRFSIVRLSFVLRSRTALQLLSLRRKLAQGAGAINHYLLPTMIKAGEAERNCIGFISESSFFDNHQFGWNNSYFA